MQSSLVFDPEIKNVMAFLYQHYLSTHSVWTNEFSMIF